MPMDEPRVAANDADDQQSDPGLIAGRDAGDLLACLRGTPHVAVECFDLSGRVQFWNRGAELLFGWGADEARGRRVGELILTPEAGEEYEAALVRIAKSGEAVGPEEFRFHAKDGREGVCLSTTIPLSGGAEPLFMCIDVDLTERRAAEGQRDDERRLLLQMAKMMPEVVHIYDVKERRELFANRSLMELLGYAEEDFAAGAAALQAKLLHPEDAPKRAGVRERLERSSEGEAVGYESRMLHASGHWRNYRQRSVVLTRDADGAARRVLSMMEDVTERERAIEELRDTEARLEGQRRVLEMIARGDALGECLDELARLVESRSEGARACVCLAESPTGRLACFAAPTLGMEWKAAWAPEEAEAGPCCAGGDCGSPTNLPDLQAAPISPARKAHYASFGIASARTEPVWSADGELLGAVSLFHLDGTSDSGGDAALLRSAASIAAIAIQRDRRESKLRETEERIRALGDRLPNGAVFQVQMDRKERARFTYFSAGMPRLLGVPAEEIYADYLAAFRHVLPEDRARLADATRMAEARLHPSEAMFRVALPGGGVRHLFSRSAPRPFPDGSLTWDGVLIDRTEEVRGEEERQALELQMQHAQKLESLGVLAGGIAHDFNNLLAAVLGHAELAQAALPKQHPACADLEKIGRIVETASELCAQMLAYAGKGGSNRARIELPKLIEDTARLLAVSIGKSAELSVAFEAGVPAVLAEPSQLRQVVMNLVINASEAIGGDGGRIELAVRAVDGAEVRIAEGWLGAEPPPGTHAMLEVSDTGVGMDAETRARVFDPFFTTKFTGRGLGLAAVLGIVRKHGGAIRVESAPGHGSRFQVVFPAAPPLERAPHPAVALRATPPPAPFAGTVLLAEDEEGVRKTAVRVLESLGFEVSAAADGIEAVHRFHEAPERFALAVLDLTMPLLSGPEVAVELRAIVPKLPILFTSGYADTGLARLAPSNRALFLRKPYHRQELESALSELLRQEPSSR